MRRRDLLALTLGAPLLAKSAYSPSLTVQVYVWTQHLKRVNKSLSDGLDEIFQGFADAGYHQVNLTSNLLTPDFAYRTSRLLKKHKLALPIVYQGGIFHEPAAARKTIDNTVALACQVSGLGVKTIVTNVDPKPKRERKTDAELANECAAIKDLGQAIRGEGMRLLLHQHAPEMAENAREWRTILNKVDNQDLGVCLDVHWILRGGQDVSTLLREAGPRIGDVHLRNSKDGIWLEDLADGDVNYHDVATYLKSIGYRGYLTVELAWDPTTTITRPLAESLKISRLYAEKVFSVKA